VFANPSFPVTISQITDYFFHEELSWISVIGLGHGPMSQRPSLNESVAEMNFLDGIQKQLLCVSLLMAAVAN
jgi:hypothetical protein